MSSLLRAVTAPGGAAAMSVAGLSASAISLGIGVEKPAIVLQIGAAYTKAGFSGEHIPRCVVPSVLQRGSRTVHIMTPTLWNNSDELREVLIDFLFEILYRKLLVKAQDRRIVIVEDMLMPQPVRDALANVFFGHYLAMSVAFISTFDAVMYPLATPSALVLDVGYGEATVMGIHAFHSIRRSFSSSVKAASALHDRIREAVHRINGNVQLSQQQLEDIAVRACVALPPPAGVTVSTAQYPLPRGQSVGLDATVRVEAANVLFEDDEYGDSLQRLLLDALNRCPIDARRALAANIVLLGGATQMPGFQRRLLQELRALCETPEYAKLRGTLVTRQVTTVMLEADTSQPLDEATLAEHAGKIKMDLLGAVPDTAIVDSFALTISEGTKVTAKIQTFETWDTAAVKSLQLTGKMTFRVMGAVQNKRETSTGVAASFAIHDSPFPANIMAWVGGAIFAALEGLAERSVTQEAYRLKPVLPDWATPENRPASPTNDDSGSGNPTTGTATPADEEMRAAGLGKSATTA